MKFFELMVITFVSM